MFGLVEHHVLKPFGVPQRGDVDAAFPEKMLIQFLQMLIEFRKLHARIRKKYGVNRHILFDHAQQHKRGIAATAQGDGSEFSFFLVFVHFYSSFLSLLLPFFGDPLFIQFRHLQEQLCQFLLAFRSGILEKGFRQEFEKRFDGQFDEATIKQ